MCGVWCDLQAAEGVGRVQGLSGGEETPLTATRAGGTAEALLPETDEATHVSEKATTATSTRFEKEKRQAEENINLYMSIKCMICV